MSELAPERTRHHHDRRPRLSSEFVDALGPLAENLTSAAWWHPGRRATPIASRPVGHHPGVRRRLHREIQRRCADYGEASSAACGIAVRTRGPGCRQHRAGGVAQRPGGAGCDDVLRAACISAPTGQEDTLQPPVFQIQGGKPLVLYPKPTSSRPNSAGSEAMGSWLTGSGSGQRADPGRPVRLRRRRVLPGMGRAERHQPAARHAGRAGRLSGLDGLDQYSSACTRCSPLARRRRC